LTELQTALFKLVKMRESFANLNFWPNLELNPGVRYGIIGLPVKGLDENVF